MTNNQDVVNCVKEKKCDHYAKELITLNETQVLITI